MHIGSGKTGTSSVQHFLHRNRASLADLGLLYPRTPGVTRHTRLGLFIQPDDALDDIASWRRQKFSSPGKFRRTFRRKLFTEINESGLSRVLFSDEALYGSPEHALVRLRHFLDPMARSLRLVVYLRRQDDHLVSRYQQVVKTGETRRLVDRMRQLDLSKSYDYYARLRTWERLMEPTEFAVRRFERRSFVEGSLLQDFFWAAGIDARADELEQVGPRNESLDADAVEFLRIVNIYRSQDAAASAMLPTNHELVTKLAEATTGPTLTAPPDLLERCMARWAESNQRVAREILGDPTGELFRTPRNSRNSTTVQRLDPDRLDDFLTRLELPEQVHVPLRDVGKREAEAL